MAQIVQALTTAEAGSHTHTIVLHLEFDTRCRSVESHLYMLRLGILDGVVERLAYHQVDIAFGSRVQWSIRAFMGAVYGVLHLAPDQHAFTVRANTIGQRRERIMVRIDGPYDVAQGTIGFASDALDVVGDRIQSAGIGSCDLLGFVAEHDELGEVAAQLVVHITGDAGAHFTGFSGPFALHEFLLGVQQGRVRASHVPGPVPKGDGDQNGSDANGDDRGESPSVPLFRLLALELLGPVFGSSFQAVAQCLLGKACAEHFFPSVHTLHAVLQRRPQLGHAQSLRSAALFLVHLLQPARGVEHGTFIAKLPSHTDIADALRQRQTALVPDRCAARIPGRSVAIAHQVDAAALRGDIAHALGKSCAGIGEVQSLREMPILVFEPYQGRDRR